MLHMRSELGPSDCNQSRLSCRQKVSRMLGYGRDAVPTGRLWLTNSGKLGIQDSNLARTHFARIAAAMQ
jgi:hypothetical protein